MKRKLPSYTHAYFDRHGNPRFYLRRPGHNIVALLGLPWSPEFMAALEKALQGSAGKVEIGAARTLPGIVNAALVSLLPVERV